MVPMTQMSQAPKQHLSQFSCFCTAFPCAQHTDRQTMLHVTPVANGRILCTACRQCSL